MDLPFADETLLARWMSGELSEAERREVEAHPHFAEWEQIARETGRLEATPFDTITHWRRLQKATTAEAKKAPASLRLLKWWPAVAAGLVLLAAAYLFWPEGERLLNTGSGEQITEQLPDASSVILNAESQLSYRSGSWADNRELELSGEAFFEVERGSRFVVHTPQGEVEVLGTSFNVYAREDGLKVYCFSGRVAVQDFSGSRLELSAGQGVVLAEGKRDPLYSSERERPSWTQGETSFRNAALSDVFATVERQFGVNVIVDSLPDLRYSGPLPHHDLEEALNVVCPPLGLKFSILGEAEVRISLE